MQEHTCEHPPRVGQEKLPVGRHTEEVQNGIVQLRYRASIPEEKKQPDQVNNDKYCNIYDNQLGDHISPAEFSLSIIPD